jgi:hypothetical protein
MTWLLITAAVLVLAAVAVELIVPRVGRSRIERRLTERGGEAEVTVRALPSLRLLRREGDLIRVRGSRIEIGMSKESHGLGALDGFHEVDIVLREFATGPFAIQEFELIRVGEGPYLMRAEALTSGVDLVGFGTPQLGRAAPAAPLIDFVARQAPLGSRPIPVTVEVELISEAGLLTVASGGGSVAGYPAGRVATVLAAAVARRLELSF